MRGVTKVIDIAEGLEVRKRREEAKRPKRKGLRLEVEPGHVLLVLGENARPGAEYVLTPKLAREWSNWFAAMARRAEVLEAEALGGPPILIELRKRHAIHAVERVAKQTKTFPAALCQPIPEGEQPTAAVVELWRELRGQLSLIDIGELWHVSPSRVGRLTKRAR